MDGMLFASFGIIILGSIILWKAGDLAVSYVLKAGEILQVTAFFLGFFILAVASALPDLSVAISSAFAGAVQVSAGDVIGANFADVALALGLAMIVAGTSIVLPKADRFRHMGIVGIAGIILAVMMSVGTLTTFHGLFLILCYISVMIWVWKNRFKHAPENNIDQEEQPETSERSKKKLWGIFIKLAASLAAVFASSTLVVHSAIDIASRCHLPLETVGATIIAIGTTLPEIVVSISAIKRRQYSLAFASTLGSVLEQGTFILGLLVSLSRKPVELRPLFGSSIFMFASFIIMIYCLYTQRLTRSYGILLVSLFAAYLTCHVFLF